MNKFLTLLAVLALTFGVAACGEKKPEANKVDDKAKTDGDAAKKDGEAAKTDGDAAKKDGEAPAAK